MPRTSNKFRHLVWPMLLGTICVAAEAQTTPTPQQSSQQLLPSITETASVPDSSHWCVQAKNVSAQVSSSGDILEIDTGLSDGNDGDYGVQCTEITLTEGAQYLFQYEAKAETPRKAYSQASFDEPSYHNVGLLQSAGVSTHWQKISQSFTAENSIYGQTSIAVFFGQGHGKVWLRHLTLVETSSPPQKPFLSGGPAPLHVEGSQIVDNNGHVVRLKGTSYNPFWFWEGVNTNPLSRLDAALQRWHFTLVRLPIVEDNWVGDDPDGDGGQAYRRMMDAAISDASAQGDYILIDLQIGDRGQWQKAVRGQEMPDDHSLIIWKDIAARYANAPGVLFDIFNEPHDVDWDTWQNGGHVAGGKSGYHTPGMQALVDAIRSTGADNIILAGGLAWANDLSGIPSHKLTGRNIVYSKHIYPSANEDWGKDVQPVLQFAPVVIGEFGASPGGTYADFMMKLISWVDSLNLSASCWSFDNNRAGPALLTDYRSFGPNYNEGLYVYSWLNHGPTPPTGLKARGNGHSIVLTWTADAGASNYLVMRSNSPGHELDNPPIPVFGQTSYTDSAVQDGQTYYYQVLAQNKVCPSGPTPEIACTSSSSAGFAPPLPTFTLSVTSSPTAPSSGAPITFTMTAANAGKVDAVSVMLVLDVYDSTGRQVLSEVQKFPATVVDASRSITTKWTPSSPGNYRITLMTACPDWLPIFTDNENAENLVVNP